MKENFIEELVNKPLVLNGATNKCMEKVINTYYNDSEEKGYHTGIYIETESGKFYRNQSSDPLMAFERVKDLPEEE